MPKVGDATETVALTKADTILGTLQYMSPEQLEGKEADGRSDVFAFGAVLYEIVTGKQAFEGKSRASVIAAILERDPPSVAGVAPDALDLVLRRCLAKDPDARWQFCLRMSAVEPVTKRACILQIAFSRQNRQNLTKPPWARWSDNRRYVNRSEPCYQWFRRLWASSAVGNSRSCGERCPEAEVLKVLSVLWSGQMVHGMIPGFSALRSLRRQPVELIRSESTAVIWNSPAPVSATHQKS
jgi:serine/threonine protein kinase